jgi:hypothetical protein
MTPVFSRRKWSSICIDNGSISARSRAASLLFSVAVTVWDPIRIRIFWAPCAEASDVAGHGATEKAKHAAKVIT